MQISSSIVLASLLFTGLATNSLNREYRSENFHQSDSVHQLLLAQVSATPSNCSSREHSPLPGCGRRDQ